MENKEPKKYSRTDCSLRNIEEPRKLISSQHVSGTTALRRLQKYVDLKIWRKIIVYWPLRQCYLTVLEYSLGSRITPGH